MSFNFKNINEKDDFAKNISTSIIIKDFIDNIVNEFKDYINVDYKTNQIILFPEQHVFFFSLLCIIDKKISDSNYDFEIFNNLIKISLPLHFIKNTLSLSSKAMPYIKSIENILLKFIKNNVFDSKIKYYFDLDESSIEYKQIYNYLKNNHIDKMGYTVYNL